MRMAMPVIVHCRESSEVEWSELTRLLDVTPFGASFSTSRRLEVGRLLHMTMPMPRQMRCFDHVADQYRVWALVRYVIENAAPKNEKEHFAVGVAFVGKNPPESYEITPGKVYQADEEGRSPATQTPPGAKTHPSTGAHPKSGPPAAAAPVNGRAASGPRKELRDGTRLVMPVDVILEVMGSAGPVGTMREQTVTENLSRRGASVFTTFLIERGTLVRLTSTRYQVSINAFVLARRIGPDGIPRLHLKFTDQQWPIDDGVK